MEPNKRRKYEQELLRLDEEHADLQQHWRRVPRFFLVFLSIPIAWVAYGFGAAVVALLVSVALVATRSYLLGVRKSENSWIRQSVAREIADDAHDDPSRAARPAPAYGSVFARPRPRLDSPRPRPRGRMDQPL